MMGSVGVGGGSPSPTYIGGVWGSRPGDDYHAELQTKAQL